MDRVGGRQRTWHSVQAGARVGRAGGTAVVPDVTLLGTDQRPDSSPTLFPVQIQPGFLLRRKEARGRDSGHVVLDRVGGWVGVGLSSSAGPGFYPWLGN